MTYHSIGKRALDVVIAAIAVPPALLMGLLLTPAVYFSMGAPILFRQARAGRDGKPFELLKIRTMTDERDETGELAPDMERITRVGRILRSTSLDELPSLLNVLRGDMSIVGPRPLPTRYVPRYSPEQARRLSVRPGITGWAQVNGRNSVGWDERFELDVWYVNSCTISLDARIVAMTVSTVLKRSGIDAAPGEAMSEFFG